MDNYTPNEIKDLEVIKQRMMDNVEQEIENNLQRPKYRWKFVMISAILTIIAILFVFNQLFIVDRHSGAINPFDFTQPTFEDRQGLYYLHGLTLGDSKSKVIELLGENYTTEFHEDGSIADLILNYEGDAKLYFYQGKLDLILLLKTNVDQFEKLFNEYNGLKFTSYGQYYLYSNETSHIIKAEFTPMGTLQLSLSHADPQQLMENAGYLKIKENNE